MTNNVITFGFIHVLQLLVLLIGTSFNKVITTFVNNIPEGRILCTVLHVPKFEIAYPHRQFRTAVQGLRQHTVADKTIGIILICLIIIIILL